MTAWAAVVAEKLKFTRAEALSIGNVLDPLLTVTGSLIDRCVSNSASVYTEMNASSKAVALGIFHKDKDTDYVAGSSQPYVELMGRT